MRTSNPYFIECKHWFVDKTSGSASNLGDDATKPARYIQDVLNVIQGKQILSSLPTGVTEISSDNWVPNLCPVSPNQVLNWDVPGDGNVYFWLSFYMGIGVYLDAFPGPKVAIVAGATQTITLYDGVMKNNDSRYVPMFAMALNIDTSQPAFSSPGSANFTSSLTFLPGHEARFDNMRHVIHIGGGVYEENLTIWRNLCLEGVGPSFGNVLLYSVFKMSHSESTVFAKDRRIPTIVVYMGNLTLDGVNAGSLWGTGGASKLSAPITAGDTYISLNSFEALASAASLGEPFRVGAFKDFAEIVDINWGFTPRCTGNVLSFTTTEITFNTNYVLLNFPATGTLAMIYSTGYATWEFPYSSITDDGFGNSVVTFTTPLDPALVAALSPLASSIDFLPCEKILLNSPILNNWPVDTPFTYHVPPALVQAFGVQVECRRFTLASSSAALLIPPAFTVAAIIQIMSGLWETKFTDRGTFFVCGNGSCAIAKYPAIEQRITMDKCYFLMLGKSHVYGAMDRNFVFPTGTMYFGKPSMTRFDMIANSTICYLCDGDMADIIYKLPSRTIYPWFRGNLYSKSLLRVPDYAQKLITATLTEDDIDYIYFDAPNTYPEGTENRDPAPMTHPDSYLAGNASVPAAQNYDTDNQFFKCASIPPINPRNLYIGAIDYILEKWYQQGHLGDPDYLLRTNRNNFWYDTSKNLVNIQAEQI
jgi:hypothetical protein